MRRRRRIKASRSLLLRILIILALFGTACDLILWAWRRSLDLEGLILNLATELLGALVTYTLLVLILERTESEESERARLIAEKESEKARLIAGMGSSVKDVAIAAAEKLSQHGWLRDGSLLGADLCRANLSGAHLNEANLSGADLSEARLRNGNLLGAFLGGAKYDQYTKWPEGLDPVEAGAILVE